VSAALKPSGRDRGQLRLAVRLGWGLALVAVALGLGASMFVVLIGVPLDEIIGGHIAVGIMLGLGFPPLGALIVARHPRHLIGWLLLVTGLTQSLANFAGLYTTYALQTRPGSLPGGPFMAWLSTWMWAPGYGIFIAVLPLLFPTGRLPSRRWRPVAWMAWVALIGIIAPAAIVTWPFRGLRVLVDPPPDTAVVHVGLAISHGMFVVLVVTAFAAVVSLVVRLRRAGSVERQQVKWFAYAAVVSVVVGAVGALVPALTWLEVLAIPCVIAGLTMAMFRHRLYDIDRIINRTLVYGLLTVVLGLGYIGGVLLGRQVLGGLTGTSSLAVAGSTLAVAGLFQPLRRRIQHAVDRRFDRRRYDAVKTIEAFSARLRSQLDLDTLSAELLSVVDQTMQPTTASLWLRPSGGGSRRTGM
jgi:MFS family permease